MESVALDRKYLMIEKARLEKERVAALGKLNIIFGALQQVENMISTLDTCEKLKKLNAQVNAMEAGAEKLAAKDESASQS